MYVSMCVREREKPQRRRPSEWDRKRAKERMTVGDSLERRRAGPRGFRCLCMWLNCVGNPFHVFKRIFVFFFSRNNFHAQGHPKSSTSLTSSPLCYLYTDPCVYPLYVCVCVLSESNDALVMLLYYSRVLILCTYYNSVYVYRGVRHRINYNIKI